MLQLWQGQLINAPHCLCIQSLPQSINIASRHISPIYTNRDFPPIQTRRKRGEKHTSSKRKQYFKQLGMRNSAVSFIGPLISLQTIQTNESPLLLLYKPDLLLQLAG